MTRKNNKPQIIHRSRPRPATRNEVEGPIALEQKFVELCDLHMRVRGTALVPPEDIRPDVVLWRECKLRHMNVINRSMGRMGWSEHTFEKLLKRGDFTIKDDEIVAMNRVAQWTLDVKAELCGQEPQSIENLKRGTE